MNYKGALVTPKGIIKNSYNPQRILNAVFGMYYSCTSIYQYPGLNQSYITPWRHPDDQAPPLVKVMDTYFGLYAFFQPTVVDAKPKAAIFLGYE